MNTAQRKANGVAPLRPPIATQVPLLSNAAATFSVGPHRVRMLVTPRQAEEWLKANTKNRKLRETVALRYASDMEAGQWKYNYAAILIAPDGTVIDGQHRLTGCTLAGVPFETDVVFNADPSVQATVDNNEVRTAADQTALAGVKNSTRACAAAALILLHRRYGIQSMNDPRKHASRIAVEKFVVENDAELQAALQTNSAQKLCAPRVIDFCNFLFREQDTQLAESFMAGLRSAQISETTSPMFQLRDRLQNNWRAKSKLPVKELIALFFKAWIAHRAGRSVRCLKWSSTEPFPEI